jgi:hypothetical protein
MWCGCSELNRRQLVKMLTVTLSAMAAGCGPTITAAQREDAQRLAAETISVDLHAHPGLVRSSTTGLDGHLERMGRGKLKVALFAAVGDGPLIGRRPQGGLTPPVSRIPASCALTPTASWRRSARGPGSAS